jgi:hypothetical protein
LEQRLLHIGNRGFVRRAIVDESQPPKMRHVLAPIRPLSRSSSFIEKGPRSEKDAAVLCIMFLAPPLARQRCAFEHWDYWSVVAAQNPEVAKILVNVIWLLWERDVLLTFGLQDHEVFTCLTFSLTVTERAFFQFRLAKRGPGGEAGLVVV